MANTTVNEVQPNVTVFDSNPMVNRAYMAATFEILSVRGFVDSIAARLVLDTGATSSLMSYNFAAAHNLELYESAIVIRGIDGSMVNVHGRTRVIPVRVENCLVDLSFVVIDNSDFDALLGLDWFELSKASITPHNRQVSIPTNLDSDWEPDNAIPFEVVLFERTSNGEDEYVNEWTFEKAEVKTEEILTASQTQAFEQVKRLITACAALDLSDLGTCNVAEFDMVLTSQVPVFQPLRRRSQMENHLIGEEINEMLKHGIIKISDSPYASQVHMVKKKCGKWRMTIDYRQLNAITVKRQWPMKSIPDILDKLAGKAIYSVIDCKSGYWQVQIAKSCQKYTAFSTSDGHFEFVKMPFGLKNAPAMFCYIMFTLFHDIRFCECYIDDIIVFSASIEEHFKHLAVVLNRLKSANIKINLDKCVWLASQVKFLGFVVSANGVNTDTEKT